MLSHARCCLQKLKPIVSNTTSFSGEYIVNFVSFTVAAQSLDVLVGLLYDPSPFTVKVVIQCFATVYPLLFRSL